MEEEIKGEEIIAAPEETAAPVAAAPVAAPKAAPAAPKAAAAAPEETAAAVTVEETAAAEAESETDILSVETEPADDLVGEDLLEEITDVEPESEPDVADDEHRPTTCAEVIAKLKELEPKAVELTREELEQLKQTFYRIHNTTTGAARQAFVEAGNDAEAFPETEQGKAFAAEEEEYKEIMTAIRDKRAAAQKALNELREQNYVRKQELMAQMQAMVDNADTGSVSYDAFTALQQEWKEIKEVPAEKASEMWKQYQVVTERFYDIRKLDRMMREYDFRKNLEIKTRLCEQAEKLAEETDIVAAFHQLQKLHQEYREAGPVSKELREDIWNRFKAASTVVNKRHQQHFDEIKKAEEENLQQKIAICEIVEGIDLEPLKSYAQWNAKTSEIIALQERWKTIGYGPQKQNQKVFERFRAACDKFFAAKSAFFKEVKQNLSENYQKKLALCEQAEALSTSTDWKETSDKLAELQKEWRTIGAVAKKQSDAVWKRFNTACNTFFSARNAAGSSQRNEEIQNLRQKKSIVNELRELAAKVESEGQEAIEDANTRLHELMEQWNGIGHVPFRDKDKIFKQYHDVVDELFDKVRKAGRRTVSRVQNTAATAPAKGRDRLVQSYEKVKQEIKTYENNLGFLTAASKNGSTLLAEMQRKMENLKEEAAKLLQTIKEMDEKEEKGEE